MAERGYDPKTFVDATMYATGVVLANDGIRSNKNIFWDKFFNYYGKNDERLIEISDEFYLTEFKNLKCFTRENPLAKKAIELARKDGKKVVLATNPVFPMAAQLERMRWSGLSESDFDLITAYENSSFCKPNPKYYTYFSTAPLFCEQYGNGHINSTFLVTDKNRYILQKVNKTVFPHPDNLFINRTCHFF